MDRILEAVLIVVAINTGLQVFQSRRPAGAPEYPVREIARAHRLPLAAVLVTAALAAGALTEVFWPGALHALRDDPSAHQWWRTFTAPFVQDGGVAGAVFNIITAAAVVALVEWCWGRWTAMTIWLVGAWAPIGGLAKLAGYHVSSSNIVAYSAGSSGATYFTAGTLCVVLLCTGQGTDRARALIGPVLALAMWLVENDGHGVVFVEGVVIGLALWGTLAAVRILVLARTRTTHPRGGHDIVEMTLAA